MKKTLAIVLMTSLMTVSCSKSGGGSSSSEESTQAATTDQTSSGSGAGSTSGSGSGSGSNSGSTTSGSGSGSGSTGSTLPALALSFSTNIAMRDFTAAQEAKYNQAISIVKKVVATSAFRTKVLNHTYGGSKTYVQNNGLTNAQIYQAILDAAESLKPAKNNTMDLGVNMYYSNNSVVGYTYANISDIYVNTKFFNQYDANEVAGNLFHEWLHKLGYGHDSSATARRPYSVPYAIGYMIRDLGKNFL